MAGASPERCGDGVEHARAPQRFRSGTGVFRCVERAALSAFAPAARVIWPWHVAAVFVS